ncbi:MAG: sulfotransferase family protein [Thermoleophilaceae bacterium]
MKVIGAGFGRTGTMSLKAALEQLGAGPCFHMIDIIRDPSTLHYWQAAIDGERVDWKEALDGWEGSVDWPGCTFYKQHMETWPEAPVLLSVRDPEAWYKSTSNSIHAAKEMAMRGELQPPEENPPSPEVMQMINGLIWQGTFNGRFGDRDYALQVFNDHIEDVKRTVPADRLVIYEIGQGWGPLAEMLGVEAPDAPFPHLNDTESFRQMFGMPAVTA